jgi:hypothetical protein
VNWTIVFQRLVERRPELAFVLLAFVIGTVVLVGLVRLFIGHLRVLERNRRVDQAACHGHQVKITERMETTFDKVGQIVERNTAALARVEVRLEEQQQPPRKE